MYDEAVLIIKEYVEKNFVGPSFLWLNNEFKKRSYQQWAAYEICDRIMDHPLDDPCTVIENFLFQMTIYEYYKPNTDSHFIFHTAAETAEELLHRLLLSLKQKN